MSTAQTPLHKVRGLGSAHTGTGHFWHERVTAVALIPLSAFFKSGTPDTFVRFAFCKQQALIEQSLGRLESYFFASKRNRV